MAADEGGVWTYVPDQCRVDASEATSQGADDFYQITHWQQYVKGLMVDLAPGIALAALSLLGFLFFTIWMCVRCGRRRAIRKARHDNEQQQLSGGDKVLQGQFMSTGPYGAQAAAPVGRQQDGRARGVTAGRFLKWTMVVLGLAVIGVSAWGLAECIKATDDIISNFWVLVRDGQQLLLELEESLSSLGSGLGALAGTLVSVQGTLQQIVGWATNIPVLGAVIGNVLPIDTIQGFLGEKGDAVVGAMTDASDLILTQVVPAINDDVLPAMDSLLTAEGWSVSIEDKWRFVVIAVLFGLLILLSAAVTWSCFFMSWGVTATALVAFLWLLNIIVMLLGLGMINGVRSVAKDACLYSEDLVIRLAHERMQGDTREKTLAALDYYLGRVDLVDSQGAPLLVNATDECNAELTAALLRQIAGVELHDALVYAMDLAELLPNISALLAGINLPNIPLVNIDLDSVKEPLANTADQLQTVLQDACNVTLLLLRENRIGPLYQDIKIYICCDLATAIYRVWVPWTVAGVLTLAFCLLASIRVVTDTVAPGGKGAQKKVPALKATAAAQAAS